MHNITGVTRIIDLGLPDLYIREKIHHIFLLQIYFLFVFCSTSLVHPRSSTRNPSSSLSLSSFRYLYVRVHHLHTNERVEMDLDEWICWTVTYHTLTLLHCCCCLFLPFFRRWRRWRYEQCSGGGDSGCLTARSVGLDAWFLSTFNTSLCVYKRVCACMCLVSCWCNSHSSFSILCGTLHEGVVHLSSALIRNVGELAWRQPHQTQSSYKKTVGEWSGRIGQFFT